MSISRSVHYLVLLLPPLLIGLALSSAFYQKQRLDNLLSDADGLVWGEGENLFTVRAAESREGELVSHTLRVIDRYNIPVIDQRVDIDHNLFGIGFVQAMQADADPDLEVMVWSNTFRRGRSFFLDYHYGRVRQLPLEEASPAAREILEDYRRVYIDLPGLLLLLVVAAPPYYILYYICRAILRGILRFMAGSGKGGEGNQ